MNPESRKAPPLPPFNQEKSLQDWLKKLQEDYSHGERDCLATYRAVPTTLVEYIFITSKQLGLSAEVKFLAVDIFDRFIRNQFKNLYTEVFVSINQSSLKRWKKIETKICSQLELRILSCLQLASKVISENSEHSKILSSLDIHEFFKKDGPFSIQDINNSEFRVFKTLDFRIGGETIITFVDAMIVGVYKHTYGTQEFEHTLEKCYRMCEILCLNHHEIFLNFYNKLTGQWDRSNSERIRFCSVERNGLLKGAAVILTTARLFLIPDETEKLLVHELSKLSTMEEECVKVLSTVILQVIFPKFDIKKR